MTRRSDDNFKRAAGWAGACLIALAGATAMFAGCGGGDDSTGSSGEADAAGSDATPFVDSSTLDVSTSSDGSTCGADQKVCGGECTSVSRDNANCGSCGNACAAGEVCSGGSCGTTCGGTDQKCVLDGGAPYCADEKTDNANCGGCGITCGAGKVCSGGTCTTTCGGELTLCGADAGADGAAPYCANEKTDNANCGGCGITCGAGKVCSGGTCTTTCGGDLTLCGADAGGDGAAPYCANEKTDNANCGGCGITCGAGKVCSGGTCTTTCGGDLTLCGADAGADGAAPYCANEQTDNANCGGCGITCDSSHSCVGGTCTRICEAPHTACGDTCVNLQTDPNNCHDCGHACPAATPLCSAGACVPLYHGWTTPVDGCDTSTYDTTLPTELGGTYPSLAGDSDVCRAWKLAATICQDEPVGYGYDTPGDFFCNVSGGFTDSTFGTYCESDSQYACSDCYGACNAKCEHNPLSLRNCSGDESDQQ